MNFRFLCTSTLILILIGTPHFAAASVLTSCLNTLGFARRNPLLDALVTGVFTPNVNPARTNGGNPRNADELRKILNDAFHSAKNWDVSFRTIDGTEVRGKYASENALVTSDKRIISVDPLKIDLTSFRLISNPFQPATTPVDAKATPGEIAREAGIKRVTHRTNLTDLQSILTGNGLRRSSKKASWSSAVYLEAEGLFKRLSDRGSINPIFDPDVLNRSDYHITPNR